MILKALALVAVTIAGADATYWNGTATGMETGPKNSARLRHGPTGRQLSSVEPGRVISKDERDARKDSVVDSSASSSRTASEVPNGRRGSYFGAHSLNGIILDTIWILIVIGGLYTLIEHLLNSTRASASEICTPTTIYVPFTATVTSTAWSTSTSIEAPSLSTTTLTVTASPTTTSPSIALTETVTVTATVTPSSSSVAAVSAAEASPDTTTTLSTTTTISSTTTVPPTVTAPEFTSSTFSLMSPDSTTTLTSTSYTTISLSAVSSSRSAFTGINTSGWNVSSSAPPQTTPEPTTTTLSNIVYFGKDNTTSLTTTVRITTTVGATITSIFTPPAFITDISGSLTTVSATPATITYTVADGSAFTTSLAGATAPSIAAGAATNAPSSLAYGLPSQPISAASVTRNTTASSQQTSPFYTGPVTITSFVDGHGITFTVKSTPVGTTPMSPPPSNSTTIGASASSFPNGPIASDSSSFGGSTSFGWFETSSSGAGTFANSTVSSLVAVATSTLITLGSTTVFTISSGNAAAGATEPPSTTRVVSTRVVSGSTEVVTIAGAVTGLSFEGDSTISTEVEASQVSTSVTQPSAAATAESASQTSSSRLSSTSARSAPVSPQSDSSLSTSTSNARSSTSARTTVSPSPSSRPARTSSSFSNPFLATSATAIPSAGCGEQGNFTMTFDDLPTYHPTRRQINNQTNGTDITQYPPLNQRPYRHMLFSQGYVYAPKAAEPFSPVSSPNVAAFVDPMKAGRPPMNSPVEPGEIGTYDEDNSAFYFDAKSAYLGCSNPGPDDCTIEATPYTYNTTLQDEVAGEAVNFTMSPCTQNCTLEQVTFPSSGFKRLSGLQFRAVADSKPRMFFIDDMAMEWSNSSCEAGMTRQRTR